jgi:hypothetical protein
VPEKPFFQAKTAPEKKTRKTAALLEVPEKSGVMESVES